MARVTDDLQCYIRPRLFQRPCRRERGNDIITAMHDHAGQIAKSGGLIEQPSVFLKESLVPEIMAFDPRKGIDEIIFLKTGGF